MKILILNHNLKEHGNYFRALKFASYLSGKKHDVKMITTSTRWYRTNRYSIGDVKVIESPSYAFVANGDDGWSPLGIVYRLMVVLLNKFDIVYAFSHKPADFIPAYISKKIRKSFYIGDWCDWYGKGGMFEQIKMNINFDPNISFWKKIVLSFYRKIEEYLEEAAPKKTDLTTVISHALYNRALSIGIDKYKLLYLVSGADTTSIVPIDKLEARNTLHFDIFASDPAKYKDTIYLGYTANYHPDEDLLLKTFEIVSNLNENTILVVVGPNFKRTTDELKKMGIGICDANEGRRMKSGDRILFFNRRPFREIKFFLAACDILLIPMSDSLFNKGRWPHKIGDYLSAGRPVVSNNVGDIPELIAGKNAGAVSHPFPADFANTIIDIIKQRDRWNEFGENARRIAETELDWNRIGDVLYEKISGMLGGKIG